MSLDDKIVQQRSKEYYKAITTERIPDNEDGQVPDDPQILSEVSAPSAKFQASRHGFVVFRSDFITVLCHSMVT